jgi:hypothetical protein
MNDQHARLSRALAEQRITKRWEQAVHARQGRGGGLLRRRHRLRASRWRQQAHRPAGQVVSRRQSDTPQAPVDHFQEPVTPKASSSPWATLLRVAWLAILLGLLLQLAMLLVAAGFGTDISPRPVLAETFKTVSWSLLVCVGVALGRVAAKGQVPLEGLTGLLAAPLALTAANAIQKGIAEALDIAGVPGGPAPVWVLAIKAAEYGCLGLALEWVGRRAWHSALGHLAVGLVTGVVFGGLFLTVAVQSAPTPLSTSSLLARGLNELLFPAGCALVIFIAEVLRTHLDPPAAEGQPLTASLAAAERPTPDLVAGGAGTRPGALTMGPWCGLERGHWACVSHRGNFRTRQSLDRHTGLGEHRLVWLCWAHGPEQPSPGPARPPAGTDRDLAVRANRASIRTRIERQKREEA